MNATNSSPPRRFLRCALFAALAFLGAAPSGHAATYQVGDVVTNFTFVNRRQWTNDDGRVFTPGTPLRLSDFNGKILFIEFFAPW